MMHNAEDYSIFDEAAVDISIFPTLASYINLNDVSQVVYESLKQPAQVLMKGDKLSPLGRVISTLATLCSR